MAQQATDMELAETLLYQLKMEILSLATAVMESPNDDVRSELTEILYQSLRNQKDIFDYMSQKGWYSIEEASQDQYRRVQQTFATMRQAASIT